MREVKMQSALQLLVQISELFASDSKDSLDSVLEKTFSYIGTFAKADRAWLMQFRRDKVLVTHQWTTDGVPLKVAIEKSYPISELVWSTKALFANQVLHVPDVSLIPADAAAEHALCAKQQVKSIIAAPIFSGGTIIAALVLDTVTKPQSFSEDVIQILQVTTQLIAPALQKQKIEYSKKELELRFQTVLDNLQEGVTIGDLDDRLVYVNQRYTQMVGYSAEELLGKPAYQFITPIEEHHRITEATARRINGATDAYELTQLHKDGRALKTVITACPYRNVHGEVVGNIASHADVTQKTKTESENQNLQQQLMQVQKMEAVGQLAAGLAHDLSNSITAVIGHLNLIKLYETENEQITKSADAALNGCHQASELIRHLLTFSSQSTLKPTVADLKTVVQDTLDLSRGLIGAKTSVKMSGQPLDYSVVIDKAQFSQVLANLIINATHAMPNGGTLGFNFSVTHIEHVKYLNPNAEPGKFAVLTVSDTGIGIQEEYLLRIFEPFFTTKSENGGTGLGLSMAYATLQKHGGWIEVDSQVGSGTAFSLYLPFASTDTDQPLGSQITVTKEQDNQTATILVIDDEPVLAELACSFLERAGFKTQSFSNPFEAFAWFEAHHASVSLVLLDMKMPGCDGSEAFERLKAIRPDTQIVLISGFVDDTEVSRLLSRGAVSFIQKPIKYSELVDWISKTVKISGQGTQSIEPLFH